FCTPHQVDADPRRANVSYTMFEATRVHPAWIARNRQHALVIVPTESSRQAWLASGMPEGQVRVCPRGVNPRLFSGLASPLPRRTRLGEGFTAGSDRARPDLGTGHKPADRPAQRGGGEPHVATVLATASMV